MPASRTVPRLLGITLTLAVAGCGNDAPSTSPRTDGASATPATSDSSDSVGIDLSEIACATADPDDVGELTGAWAGNDTGVYYIRQVGDCVRWFGTELDDIESGRLGQPGFANVARGRVDGRFVVVEWADLPAGDVLGGGGLSLPTTPRRTS